MRYDKYHYAHLVEMIIFFSGTSWLIHFQRFARALFSIFLIHLADKLCDQVSDSVLDACLAQDPESRVGCETAAKTGMVMIFGEITTKVD